MNKNFISKNYLIAILSLVAVQCAAQLPSYLPTNGLVAWYPFNGNANDESGNGNNGVVNGALLTSDRFESTNKAYYFDGLTSSIVIPHSSDFNFELNNSYSISFWLKPEILSANQAQIVAMKQEGVGYTQDGWNSFIEPNYKMNFFVQNGSNPYSGCNRGIVTTSIFQHVAQVFRPDSVIVFINGVWAGAEPSNGATVGNNSNSLFFGLPWWGLIYSNTRGYNGILDDVAIYNRALTQTEVAAIYTSTPTNTGGGTTSTTPAPPGIPYQAEVRNENGEVLANANVNVRFTLHELTANGTVSYQETHAITTNELGLFAANIGAGTATQGTFTGINWSQTNKFLQVEVDTGNGYITMGNQQLMSVPYALYAANGPAGPQGPVGPAGPAGAEGQPGANGLSAYEVWLAQGNSGTEQDFLNSLHVSNSSSNVVQNESGIITQNLEVPMFLRNFGTGSLGNKTCINGETINSLSHYRNLTIPTGVSVRINDARTTIIYVQDTLFLYGTIDGKGISGGSNAPSPTSNHIGATGSGAHYQFGTPTSASSFQFNWTAANQPSTSPNFGGSIIKSAGGTSPYNGYCYEASSGSNLSANELLQICHFGLDISGGNGAMVTANYGGLVTSGTGGGGLYILCRCAILNGNINLSGAHGLSYVHPSYSNTWAYTGGGGGGSLIISTTNIISNLMQFLSQGGSKPQNCGGTSGSEQIKGGDGSYLLITN